MRKFLFSYWFEGSRYSFEVSATDAEEAKRRLMQITNAEYDGELFASIPIPGGGWLSRLFGR